MDKPICQPHIFLTTKLFLHSAWQINSRKRQHKTNSYRLWYLDRMNLSVFLVLCYTTNNGMGGHK